MTSALGARWNASPTWTKSGAASSVVSMFASSCFANELRVRRVGVVVLHAAIEGLLGAFFGQAPAGGLNTGRCRIRVDQVETSVDVLSTTGKGTTVPCRARGECLVIE